MATDNAMKKTADKKNADGDFTLSADANRAVQEMISLIESLHKIYLTENGALKAADTKVFLALQETKINAARRYQQAAAQLMNRKDELKGKIDPRLAQALKARQNEFAVISRDNLEGLERMRRCTKRLSERIMEAARDTVAKNGHAYGKRGHMQASDRRVSLSLNESA